jgi:biopolymer transport protein ExbD
MKLKSSHVAMMAVSMTYCLSSTIYLHGQTATATVPGLSATATNDAPTATAAPAPGMSAAQVATGPVPGATTPPAAPAPVYYGVVASQPPGSPGLGEPGFGGGVQAAPGIPPTPGMPATPVVPSAGSPTGFFSPYNKKADDELKILSLKNADASTTAEQLKALTADKDVVIVPDGRTNQLIVRGSKQDLADLEAIAQKLDETATQQNQHGESRMPGALQPTASDKVVTVFRLENIPAEAASNALQGAMNEVFSQPGSTIHWNQTTNGANLVVSAPKSAMPQIAELVKKLDVPGAKTIHTLTKPGSVNVVVPDTHVVVDQALSQAKQLADQTQQMQVQVQQLQQLEQEKAKLVADGKAQDAAALQKLLEEQRRNFEQVRRNYEIDVRPMNGNRWQVAEDPVQRSLDTLANEIRLLAAQAGDNPSDEQKDKIEALKAKLKEKLSDQFEQRQKEESEELQQLRQRLDKLEKEISDRAQNRDKVLQQRLDNLISAAQPNSGQQQITFFNVPASINSGTGGGTLQLQGVTNVNPEQFVTGTVKLEPGKQGTVTVNPLPAAGSAFEVHIDGPKAPKVGEQIELILTVTNRGTVNTPVLKFGKIPFAGLAMSDQLGRSIGILAPGESKEIPLHFLVTRIGKISFSATVQGEGVPATATYTAQATPADTADAGKDGARPLSIFLKQEDGKLSVYLNDELVTEKQFRTRLSELESPKDQTVNLSTDANIDYNQVAHVQDVLKSAGIHKVTLSKETPDNK